jgi:hypothetical protein
MKKQVLFEEEIIAKIGWDRLNIFSRTSWQEKLRCT